MIQLVSQIAMNMFMMLGPSIATIAITSTMNGNAKKRSTIRMIVESTQPPTNPEKRPIAVPTTSVTEVAPNAISRSMRPP